MFTLALVSLIGILHHLAAGTINLPADYPQLPAGPPILPSPYRNYFSLDGDAGQLVRTIAGPGLLPEDFFDYPPFRTTPTPTWTRPTTPKDELVNYFERAFDRWLSGGYRPRAALRQVSGVDSNAIEADSLLFSTDEKSPKSVSKNKDGEDLNDEGSGEAPSSTITTTQSSIAGIPKIYPNISKVPMDFGVLATPAKSFNKADDENARFGRFRSRPEVPQGGYGPLAVEREIRRHPGKSQFEMEEKENYFHKNVDQFQYGSKPTYKQGFMSSVLNFLGLPQVGEQTTELDRALTNWLLQHAPTYTTKAEKRANVPSGYSSFQKFISQSMMPLCTPQPESIEQFDVHAFMGQWFQVMHSPLMSSSSCSMMSYELLTDTPNGVGAIFQVLEYSVPRIDEMGRGEDAPVMTSGHAVVSRPGQLLYRKSNSPEDAIVHVLHVGESPTTLDRYEYAILSINCNYPLYVIARDPDVFEQRYASTVKTFLQRHGLVNKLSLFLNIVKPVDFSQCRLPPTFFDEVKSP